MRNPPGWLMWRRQPDGMLERRRAEAITRRIRGFALLFAALTVAWIGVDAAVFPDSLWMPLAAIRMGAGVALLALAAACPVESPSLGAARSRLALLFAVAAAFHLATLPLTAHAPPSELSQGLSTAYTFLPFVLAAGAAAFPLAAGECLAVAAFALAVETASQAWGRAPLPLAGALWLQSLIALAASFSSLSQYVLMEALVGQAVRDPLTGCMRRESGLELLQLQLRIARRQEEPLTVLFADIDRFKEVNDLFGHEAGDRVLAETADALACVLRASDFLIRWGGEEFVLALPGTGSAEAVTLLDRLRRHGAGLRPDGKPVTLSMGIAEYREDGAETAHALVELADGRMYAAKQAGRNRYVSRSGEAALLLEPAT